MICKCQLDPFAHLARVDKSLSQSFCAAIVYGQYLSRPAKILSQPFAQELGIFLDRFFLDGFFFSRDIVAFSLFLVNFMFSVLFVLQAE